jgi:two-component system, response regulator YesN
MKSEQFTVRKVKKLISILVLDDEVFITKGLISKINRINHDMISTIYEANNPYDALKIIELNKPSIIITDMKMPEMNGLEFIKAANPLSPLSQFIILSGYDDYQFVRKSFQQGAIDYLLKPISIEDLSVKLDEVIKVIELTSNRKNKYDIKLEKSINLLQSSDEQQYTTAFSYVRSILPFSYYQLASLSLPHEYELTFLNNYTKKITSLFGSNIKVFSFFDGYKNSTLIFNFNELDDQLAIANCLSQFLYELKSKEAPISKIALTAPYEGLNQFSDMFKALTRILAGKIMYPSYSLMIHEAVDVALTPVDKDVLDSISKWFLHKDFPSIHQFIEQYFTLKPINVASLYTVERIYLILLQKINALFNDHDLIQATLFTKPFLEFDSLTSIRLYLKGCLFKVQNQLSQKDTTVNSIIDAAIFYINENIEKDIDMAQISNHLSMNYSYFSKLFKETKGISFKKYLIQTRMENAQNLLKDPTNKIYEIATRVGYDNAQNFSRAFKAHFGYSPKEYRQE